MKKLKHIFFFRMVKASLFYGGCNNYLILVPLRIFLIKKIIINYLQFKILRLCDVNLIASV